MKKGQRKRLALFYFGIGQKRWWLQDWREAADVAAEDAEFAGGGTDVGEGSVESGNIAGFDIDGKN